MHISWERSADGKPVRRQERHPIAGPHVQPLAWRIVTDVVRVRAKFAGKEIGFAPVMTLLAKHSHWSAGWSLLLREASSASTDGERSERTGPDFCLRTCTWDNAEALRGLSKAISPREYIMTKLPLQCAIRFFSTGQLPVAPLMGQTAQLLSAGVRFDNRERIDQGGEIDFRFFDGLQTFRITYFPATKVSLRLEGLFAEWHAFFENADRAREVVPDESCSVAYEESVWERLQRYR